jgi:hypothetical protein
MNEAIPRLPLLQGTTRTAVFLLVMAGLVFFAPYHFPVAPNVSLSYLTGFSNRAAFLIFALGCVVFAGLTRGDLGEQTTNNQRLRADTLVKSLIVVSGFCLLSLYPLSTLPHGQESQYTLNRVQMLVAGYRPYLAFEYAYGPAQLYVPFALTKLGFPAFAAFYVWWGLQWLLGTAMLWYLIRFLDLPLQHRRLFFWALFAVELTSVFTQAIVYTPVRAFGSAFLILTVYHAWRRWHSPNLTALCGVVATACGLFISPELGAGVGAGLLCWFLLLAVSKNSTFTGRAWALFVVGIMTLLVISNRLGVFTTLKSFASGAYCYPLLPTFPVLTILCVYLVAACAAARELIRRNYESIVIPMAIGGFAMLPAAMGRCDLWRLQSAAPAFVLGVAVIESAPSIRIWWRPLALCTLLLPLAVIGPIASIRHELQRIRHPLPSLSPPPNLSGCSEIYRTPNVWPSPAETRMHACLDTGYYIDWVNVYSPTAIQRKIEELDRAPRQPLLLFDRPLSEQMKTEETDPSDFNLEGPLLFQPKIKRQPVTYSAIFLYIQQNYMPDPEPISRHGIQYRVWRPKNP